MKSVIALRVSPDCSEIATAKQMLPRPESWSIPPTGQLGFRQLPCVMSQAVGPPSESVPLSTNVGRANHPLADSLDESSCDGFESSWTGFGPRFLSISVPGTI